MLIITFILLSQVFAASGQYFVPVEAELEEHALFAMEKISIVQNDEFVTLSYVLPTNLTGIELPASTFTGIIEINKKLKLSGTFGDAECDTFKIEVGTQCFVKYNKFYKAYLNILDPQIEAAMNTNSNDPIYLDIKKQIWEKFSGDPLGYVIVNELDLIY